MNFTHLLAFYEVEQRLGPALFDRLPLGAR
jgi:hypothetical protein